MLKKQKRVVAIHDISCVGKCSLTVALPILSAAGAETKYYSHGGIVDSYWRIHRLYLPRPYR